MIDDNGSMLARCNLGDIANIRYGKAKPKSAGVVPVVGSGGIYAYTSEPLADETAIIVGRKGTAGNVTFPQAPSWPADTTFFVEPDTSRVLPEYLALALRAADLGGASTKTTLPSLQLAQLTGLAIDLPSLARQRRVCRSLSAIERVTSAAQRRRQTLTATRASVSEALFRQISADLVALGEIATVERGRFSHRPRNDPRFYGGDIPFIQTGDITAAAAADGLIHSHSQTLNERGLAVSRLFPAGTIAITIAANIGYSARLTYPAAFPDSIIAISPDSRIDPSYLRHFLATQQPEMDRRAPRGTQKNINIEFLKPWPVPCASLSDQRRITNAIGSVDRAIVSTTRYAERSQAVFDAALIDLVGQAR